MKMLSHLSSGRITTLDISFAYLTNDIVFFFLLKPYPNRGRNFRIILFVVIYQWGKIHGCCMNVSQRSFARVKKGMVVV